MGPGATLQRAREGCDCQRSRKVLVSAYVECADITRICRWTWRKRTGSRTRADGGTVGSASRWDSLGEGSSQATWSTREYPKNLRQDRTQRRPMGATPRDSWLACRNLLRHERHRGCPAAH